MNRVKLAVTGIVCMFVFGYTIQSCNDENVVLKLDIPEEYNEVGVLHNEGLDFIFEKIKVQAIESVKSPSVKRLSATDDHSDFIKQATLDFCKKNKKLNKNLDEFHLGKRL